PAGEATIMDEFVTDRATGPASPQDGLIPIEVFLTNSAQARLCRKQHRLPFTTAFSNAHSERVYGATNGKTSEGSWVLGQGWLSSVGPFAAIGRSVPHIHADGGRRPSGK